MIMSNFNEDENYELECEKCGWIGKESDLVTCEDMDGQFKGCPTCRNDYSLIDI